MFLAAQIAHVLVVAFKTNLPVSEEVRAFVANGSPQCRSEDIGRALERKLPQAAAQVELLWNDLLSGGTQRCPAPTRAAIL